MFPDPDQMQARMAAEERFVAERGGQRWIETYIQPFYLAWMESNAADGDGFSFDALDQVRARAQELSVEDIAAMCSMQWRIQVMGAWYAIARADAWLSKAVHRGFDWCFGSLTSAPLATAALIYRNEGTRAVLRGYYARTREAGQGDEAIIEAAMRRLDLQDGVTVMADETEALDRLLTVAGALRAPLV